MVGMSSSPPATPITAATTPMPKPARTPTRKSPTPDNAGSGSAPAWLAAKTIAMPTRSTAITRYNVAVRMRVAQDAPTQAPARLPTRRFTTMGQLSATSASGTANSAVLTRPSRDEEDDTTTTADLMALGTQRSLQEPGREPEPPIMPWQSEAIFDVYAWSRTNALQCVMPRLDAAWVIDAVHILAPRSPAQRG